VIDINDLQSIRRKTVVAGMISEYHHAASPQLRRQIQYPSGTGRKTLGVNK
jgi:hypothetical protein